MKPALMPAICGAALALMARAAGSHFFSTRQLVTFAALGGPAAIAPPVMTPDRSGATDKAGTLALIDEIRRQNDSLQQSLVSAEGATRPVAPAAVGDDKLDAILRELVDQNRFLRDQVAETNRDLMELQFRVDTHSESFRPLKLEEGAGDFAPLQGAGEYDTSIGVLPPLDSY